MSNHANVAHKWASREIKSGRSGNISFNGDTIYSYHWWPMAKWHTAADGTEYVIMPDKPYSNSTEKHMNHVRMAIPRNVPVYGSLMRNNDWWGKSTPRLEPDTVLPYMLEKITDEYNTAFNMRSYAYDGAALPEDYKYRTEGIHAAAVKFCEMTGMPWLEDIDVYVISDSEQRMLDRMIAPVREKLQERIANREERERQIALAYDDAIQEFGLNPIDAAKKWMNGELIGYWVDIPTTHPYYKLTKNERIQQIMATAMRIEGEYVVTNHSASVPVREAKILWERMKAGKSVHGEKVGYYVVRSWNGELVIGYHHIPREIVEYFVELYNW